MKILNFKKFLIRESLDSEKLFIVYNHDRYVYHITSKSCELSIAKDGFKTGEELNVCEKRKAVYFSDKDVNYGIYARNQEGETYAGEEIGMVEINIKGLKLLNMNFKEDGLYKMHKLYNGYVVRGELDKIPYDIDGTISYLSDGRIYEVALKKEVANKIFFQ